MGNSGPGVALATEGRAASVGRGLWVMIRVLALTKRRVPLGFEARVGTNTGRPQVVWKNPVSCARRIARLPAW